MAGCYSSVRWRNVVKSKNQTLKHPKFFLGIGVAITLWGLTLAIFALMTTSDHSEIVKGHTGSFSGHHTRSWGMFITGLFMALFGASRVYILARYLRGGPVS